MNSDLLSFYPPRDPRTRGWLLLESTPYLYSLLVAYVLTVKIFLPTWMRHRKPFELLPYIRAYNIFMIVANAWYFVQMSKRSYLGGGFNFVCQGITHKVDSETMRLLDLHHQYLFIRIIDLLDTIFFGLRKKWEHISVLHVAHHCIVVFLVNYGAQYGVDCQPLGAVLINQVIHVIMYSYYFLASFGSRFQKYLWWKRYLTQLQLAQFMTIIIHSVAPLLFPCENLPGMHIALGISSCSFFLIMFLQFYFQKYLSSRGAKTR
ncbi:elongation of very long chain fatty acids protein AAEL008004-like [Galendromus occidentalis]|uniref:Elongation of very long chain fatty acids protein n=1 Tax=Galendromus occidentalis TaxID=34638 RepID=A0AAJ7WH99_9ACAR|nr:elongation of very long chain fatty acids protein AAEL008004-like [Galendromus occidentalis]